MNTDKKISRRDALKRMGAAVVCGAVASSGLLSFASCEAKGSKRVILYFTGTGNCLYVARQIGGNDAGIQNCPQKAIRFIESEDGSFPTGTEKNPNARYRNKHVSLMDIKRANSQF